LLALLVDPTHPWPSCLHALWFASPLVNPLACSCSRSIDRGAVNKLSSTRCCPNPQNNSSSDGNSNSNTNNHSYSTLWPHRQPHVGTHGLHTSLARAFCFSRGANVWCLGVLVSRSAQTFSHLLPVWKTTSRTPELDSMTGKHIPQRGNLFHHTCYAQVVISPLRFCRMLRVQQHSRTFLRNSQTSVSLVYGIQLGLARPCLQSRLAKGTQSQPTKHKPA
jgi:hypothetical protein